jgi:anti-anti-sigma regulatory factor
VAQLTTRRIRERRVFVQMSGELDAASCDDVERALLPLADAGDVTVHVGRVTRLDPDGVQMLVTCGARAAAAGNRLRVIGAHRDVRRALERVERDGWRRPVPRVPGEMPPAPASPPTTTADEQRSRPDSEQILRLQCEACDHPTFRPESAPAASCPACGGRMRAVAIFRDRRRVQLPVEDDRRRDD